MIKKKKNNNTPGTRGKLPNTINTILKEPTINIIFNGKRPLSFPLRSGTRQGCPLLPLQPSTGISSQNNQARKIKSI